MTKLYPYHKAWEDTCPEDFQPDYDENKFICEKCEEERPIEDSLEIDGKDYCNDCALECDQCQEPMLEKDIVRRPGLDLCDDCSEEYDENMLECSRCQEPVHPDDAVSRPGCEHLCPECAGDYDK